MISNKKEKEFLSILPGSPLGATVLDGNVGKAIQVWKRRVKDSGIIKDVFNGQEFIKPSVKRRKIIQNAQYLQLKNQGKRNV